MLACLGENLQIGTAAVLLGLAALLLAGQDIVAFLEALGRNRQGGNPVRKERTPAP